MRVGTTALAAVALLASLAIGCSNDDGVVDPNAPGTITGTVTASNGGPVAGASITTVPATQSLLTGADGSFTIDDVPPGTYVVAASKQGLNPASTSVALGAGRTVTADLVLGAGPANGLPNEPSSPVPADASVGQPTEITLRWNASDPDNDTLRFDVLIGTVNPPTTVVTSNQLQRVHYIPKLDSNTTYYWQVIARDGRGGVASSPIWRFRTEAANENKPPTQPGSPVPANMAVNVASPVQLSWSASDPDQDALSFDVYFGTTETPSLVGEGLQATTLARTNLAPNSVYYWRVVARDNHGGSTSGPLWRFTTGDAPEQPAGGLVAHYRFDGNAADASGRGHNGSIIGAQPTTDRMGSAGKALFFNTGSYVHVPHSTELNFSGSFSIGAWIRLSGPQAHYTGIVSKGPKYTEWPGYMLLIMSGNVVGTATGQPEYAVVTGQRNLNDGDWHFVTLVVDAPTKTLSLYVDGVLDRRSTAQNMTLLFDTEEPLVIGVERNGVNHFEGSIDDVRLYSRVLLPGEIEQLANE